MRDEQVDVARRKLCEVERAIARVRHRSHGILEHLAPPHVHEVRTLGEDLRRHRVCGAALGTIEQVRERAIAAHVAREDAALLGAALHDRRARAVAEQHAGIAVLPVHDPAQQLRADDEDRLDAAGGHHRLGDLHAVQPAAARGADVEGHGSRRAERRLQLDGRGGQQPVGRAGADDDHVELGGAHPSGGHRVVRRLRANGRERLTRTRDVPLANAGALANPRVVSFDADCGEFVVPEHALRDGIAGPCDHCPRAFHATTPCCAAARCASRCPICALIPVSNVRAATCSALRIAVADDFPCAMMLTPRTPRRGAPPVEA